MLDDRQKKTLRGLAHERHVLITVGARGLTEALLAEAESTLAHHELMKIRVTGAERQARDRMIERLCAALRAELVQRVGHVATLYRANPKRRRIYFD